MGFRKNVQVKEKLQFRLDSFYEKKNNFHSLLDISLGLRN